MTEIYLDNASTTRPSPAVREAMLACLEESALPRQAGQILRTRARASRRAWGEEA